MPAPIGTCCVPKAMLFEPLLGSTLIRRLPALRMRCSPSVEPSTYPCLDTCCTSATLWRTSPDSSLSYSPQPASRPQPPNDKANRRRADEQGGVAHGRKGEHAPCGR